MVSGTTNPDGWHKLGLEIDYNTNLSRFFVDDTQLGAPISFAANNPSGVLARGALVAYTGPDVPDLFTRADHAIYFDNYSVSAVPEPSSIVLAGFGLAGVGLYFRNKRVRSRRESGNPYRWRAPLPRDSIAAARDTATRVTRRGWGSRER